MAENMYPIGSIYMSCSDTNPSVIFGFGTWELIKDTFLLGAGDVYEAGSTGGEATHQLSVEEMPSHAHYEVVHFSHEGSEWTINPGAKSSWWETESVNQNTGFAGGNQPHNNMPPYLAVYIWKRVA